jgi:hypothetical protein
MSQEEVNEVIGVALPTPGSVSKKYSACVSTLCDSAHGAIKTNSKKSKYFLLIQD